MPTTEIRMCRACGEAAAVSVRDWEGTAFFGTVKTGRVPRRDFVCQACGAGFPVEPWRLRLFVGLLLGPEFLFLGGILGLVSVPALLSSPGFALGMATLGAVVAVVGVFATGWGLQPSWIRWTRPVVPEAPPPEVRFRLTEPVRRCGCGQPVTCTSVVRNTTNGVPTGTEWTYGCGACGREFVVESAWGQVFTVIASSVALAIGALLLSTASGQGAGAWACASAVALMGVAGWSLAFVRFVARFRFPVVPQGELPGS